MIFPLCFYSALPLNLLPLKNRAADRGVKRIRSGSLSGCSASPRYAIAGSQEHPSPARHLRPGQSVHRASASIALPSRRKVSTIRPVNPADAPIRPQLAPISSYCVQWPNRHAFRPCPSPLFKHSLSSLHCAAVFIKSIRWRARKTILSPALISPDSVHRRKATLRGSMRRVLQNVSSPNWCCSAWQLLQSGTE
jgi:hypothetical protein